MNSIEWPARAAGQTPDKTGRPDEPWWTRDAITWMETHLGPTMNVLEWGSGASTAWLAQRVGYVTTMEHDNAWSERTIAALRELHLANRWQLLGRPLGFPYISEAIAHAAKWGEVDAVIVDGRLRVFCCVAAAEVMKSGGILLFDNAQEEKYAEVHELLKDWPVIHTDNGIWRTDIFTKP